VIQGNQVGLNLNRTYQLPAYADRVNLLGDNIETLKNTGTLINVSQEVGLQVKVEKTTSSPECSSKSKSLAKRIV
jgi:hypothetical protein